MATVYDLIGQGASKAELAVSKACGQVVGFVHRNDAGMALHAQFVDRKVNVSEQQRGRMTERSEYTILLPEQTALTGYAGYTGTGFFAQGTGVARPVTEGDQVEYPINSGRLLFVKLPVQEIHNGHSWIIKCIGERTLTAGPKD